MTIYFPVVQQACVTKRIHYIHSIRFVTYGHSSFCASKEVKFEASRTGLICPKELCGLYRPVIYPYQGGTGPRAGPYSGLYQGILSTDMPYQCGEVVLQDLGEPHIQPHSKGSLPCTSD